MVRLGCGKKIPIEDNGRYHTCGSDIYRESNGNYCARRICKVYCKECSSNVRSEKQ